MKHTADFFARLDPVKQKHGIVVLINGDVHAVYIVPEETQTAMSLTRIREGIAACKSEDDIKSIRIQRCIFEEKTKTDDIIQDIKNSIL